MTVRSLSSLILAAGLGLTNPIQAREVAKPKAPQPAPTAQPAAANQQLADAVAARLKASGLATGADVRISTQKGVVQLGGHTRSLQQRDEIVRTVLSVPGVTSVQHSMSVMTGGELMQAQGQGEPAPLIIPGPGAAPPYAAGAPIGTNDPIPLAPPTMPAYDPHGPQLPPHAWPTYAPYNNVSRVAYPQAYPYNAFPYIGPFYPFPKVPLGFRSVQLTWEDGHWYYGKVATPHDYWRVRFW